MKKEIPIDKLEFGMFIAELDRPWTETPFMFQGFVLSSRNQLDALRKYCKKVYIDPEKTVAMEEPGAATKTKPPSALSTIKEKAAYQEKAPIAAEMPTSPGTLRSVPVMTNLAEPRLSVTPSCASSDTSSAGSTTTFGPL